MGVYKNREPPQFDLWENQTETQSGWEVSLLKYIYIPGPSKGCTLPIGFHWAPLEGPGIC